MIRVAAPVTVRAARADARYHSFAIGAGVSARVNYAEYTEAATRMLQAELARQGAVSEAGEKSLEVAVQYISCVNSAGSSACVIDYTVTTGDGRTFGLQARDWAFVIATACDGALGDMVTETLSDPSVVSYLTETRSPEEPARPGRTTEEQLEEIDDLRHKGLLTPEEYERKRQQILDQL